MHDEIDFVMKQLECSFNNNLSLESNRNMYVLTENQAQSVTERSLTPQQT